MNQEFVIATRESRLALWQAEHVQALLRARGLAVRLLGMTTRGDQILDRRRIAHSAFTQDPTPQPPPRHGEGEPIRVDSDLPPLRTGERGRGGGVSYPNPSRRRLQSANEFLHGLSSTRSWALSSRSPRWTATGMR